MNILVITASPRRNGNTEIMAETFAKSAQKAGHKVTIKKLSILTVAPCLGCQYCFTHDGICIQDDDMNPLLKDLQEADLLVLASPIYWFDVSAQMKCFIDRMYACSKIGFHIRSVAMLLNSRSDHVYAAPKALLKAMCSYLNCDMRGMITISGMTEKGSMKQSPGLKKVEEFAAHL